MHQAQAAGSTRAGRNCIPPCRQAPCSASWEGTLCSLTAGSRAEISAGRYHNRLILGFAYTARLKKAAEDRRHLHCITTSIGIIRGDDWEWNAGTARSLRGQRDGNAKRRVEVCTGFEIPPPGRRRHVLLDSGKCGPLPRNESSRCFRRPKGDWFPAENLLRHIWTRWQCLEEIERWVYDQTACIAGRFACQKFMIL